MDVRIGPYRRLSTEELMLSHCGAGERLLRVPWTARRSINPKGNQPWIFTERTDIEAEAPILWPLVAKSWLIGKDPDAGKIEGRRRVWQMMRWLGISDTMAMSLSRLQKLVIDRAAWHATVHGDTKSWTQRSNWTEQMWQASFRAVAEQKRWKIVALVELVF